MHTEAAAHAATSEEMKDFCADCPNCGRCPQPCKFWNARLQELMQAPSEHKEV